MSTNGPITRDHIEDRFRSIQTEIEGVETETRSYATIAVAAVAVTVVVLVFALGSRRGRKRRTFVEIRRV
jgi:ABC-type tungstate transport system substrate-binding protein